MSAQAQFYEAMRADRAIEQRQSAGLARQIQQPKYQSRYIADGVLRQDDMYIPLSYNPLRRVKRAQSTHELVPSAVPEPTS